MPGYPLRAAFPGKAEHFTKGRFGLLEPPIFVDGAGLAIERQPGGAVLLPAHGLGAV